MLYDILRIRAKKVIIFFTCVQDLFNQALSPQYGTCHWGRIGIKGNVLRGEVVLKYDVTGGVVEN